MPETHHPVTPQPAVDRYPGVLPFTDTEVDRQRFFGREEESAMLLHQFLSTELLVLFAKPGLGKTSLLNARIFRPLRDRDFLPLPVRFDHVDPSLGPMRVFAAAFQQAAVAEKVDYTPGSETSLWEFFKTAIFWRGERLQTPVLVLDQFEEIFNLQSEEFRRSLAAELGQLIGRRLPDHVREKLRTGQELGFSERPPEVKVLISLREDDLGSLEDFSLEIPSILQNRFRLTGLSVQDARSAITGPAKLESAEVRFTTEAFEYNEAATAKLIDSAREKHSGIDPFFLQILCNSVEKHVRERQQKTDGNVIVDTSYVGSDKDISRIAGEFYLDAIGVLPAPARESAKRLCEEFLLTMDGRRKSAPKEDIEKETGLASDTLDVLEQKRLLRKESKHGSLYYEIAHDRLAQAIAAMRLPEEVRLEAERRRKAEEAVKQAQAAREAAEGVFDFVIFDLRDKLTRRGELALLEDIQKGVIDYYERMGTTGETDQILRRKSVAYATQGNLFENRGNLTAAFEVYRKSFEITENLVRRDPSEALWQGDLAAAHLSIGGLHLAQGDLEETAQAYEESVRLLQKLVEKEKDNPTWQGNLAIGYRNIGHVQRVQGDLPAASRFYQQSLEILLDLVAKHKEPFWQSRLSSLYDAIGGVQQAQGEFKTAFRSHQQSLELAEMLVENDSNDSDRQLGLAISLNGMGDIKCDFGELEDALKDYRAMMKIIEELAAPDSTNLLRQRDLAPCYERIATLQRLQGKDLEGALKYYTTVVEILERLTEHDPTNADWRNDLASSYNNLGDVHRDKKNWPDALIVHRKALKISAFLTANSPTQVEWQRELGRSYHNIGEALASEDPRGALDRYHQGLEIREWLAKLDLTHAECQADHAETLWKTGTVLQASLADKKGAAANYRKALDILRPLAEQGRLKAANKGWIATLETLEKTAA